MLAVMDETAPSDSGGIYYVVAATIILHDDSAQIRERLRGIISQPGRKRPFHWSVEGSEIRARMIACLGEIGAVAHVCVHYPTGRKRQELARAHGIKTLLPLLLNEGVDELLIESRGEALVDNRDKRVIVGTLQSLGNPTLSYAWRDKSEELLWLADAVCGSIRDYLMGENSSSFEQLRELGVVTEPIYIRS
jgi:hypothetical protein